MKIYFLPFKKSFSEIFVSTLRDSVIGGENLENITIENINIEATSFKGIYIQNSKNVTVKNVKIFNIGTTGIQLVNCMNCVVRDSLVHNTLDTAMIVSGGNRKTLMPSNNLVENVEVFWFGNYSRKEIDEYFKHGELQITKIPPSGTYENNAFINSKITISYPKLKDDLKTSNTIEANESDVADFANGDFSVLQGSRLHKLGFKPIDMHEMGLIKEKLNEEKKSINPFAYVILAVFIIVVIAK